MSEPLTLFPLWQSVSHRKLGVYTCINFVNRFFFWVHIYIYIHIYIYFFFGWRLLGLRGLEWLWEQLKMRGAQFSATLNLKSILASYCREQTSTGILHGKETQKSGAHCCHTVSYSTFGVGLTERARKLQKPRIQDVIFLRRSLWYCSPPAFFKSLRNFSSSAKGDKEFALQCGGMIERQCLWAVYV